MVKCSTEYQNSRRDAAEAIAKELPGAAADLKNLHNKCEGLKVPPFDLSPETRAQRSEEAGIMMGKYERDPKALAAFDLHSINTGNMYGHIGQVDCSPWDNNERDRAARFLAEKASPAVGTGPIKDLKELNEFCNGSGISSKFDMSPKAKSQRSEAAKKIRQETGEIFGPSSDLEAINYSPSFESLRKETPPTIREMSDKKEMSDKIREASRKLYDDLGKPELKEIP